MSQGVFQTYYNNVWAHHWNTTQKKVNLIQTNYYEKCLSAILVYDTRLRAAATECPATIASLCKRCAVLLYCRITHLLQYLPVFKYTVIFVRNYLPLFTSKTPLICFYLFYLFIVFENLYCIEDEKSILYTAKPNVCYCFQIFWMNPNLTLFTFEHVIHINIYFMNWLLHECCVFHALEITIVLTFYLICWICYFFGFISETRSTDIPLKISNCRNRS